MVEGALVDTGYGAYSVASWLEGVPQVSRWFGLKVNTKAVIATKAYRCSRCSFVELYAPPKSG